MLILPMSTPDYPAILDAAGADNGKEEDPVTMISSMERSLKDMESLLYARTEIFIACWWRLPGEANEGAKPDCVTVQKKFSTDRNRVMTAYEVRDKPSALKAKDWDRFVAVFVLGKEWQFKDWPFEDHVEIFNKIIGFFMRFEDDSISKNKRHQDRAAPLEFLNCVVPEGVPGTSGVPVGKAAGDVAVHIH
ncbi:hypothetical protein GH714_020039 [Hevea brasiliensis]|uniref:Cell division control protein 73 C-terminal domain-containing protein n=1 Tax=Hevea brasiliensis TaxID=3981 RepID=A0A6A6K612_HEVBR|nr:hypothetical protein GH714_020039 [Hevea brasiliensis]